jgi:biotin carboxyl carrier protein
MKMEHRIEAPLAGTVIALHVTQGETVTAGAPLVTIA